MVHSKQWLPKRKNSLVSAKANQSEGKFMAQFSGIVSAFYELTYKYESALRKLAKSVVESLSEER